MAISRRNSEMYDDPTAYEALTRIEIEEERRRVRPLVYICSPYSGDVQRNTFNACRYSRFAVKSGYIPVTPHLMYPQFLNDNDPAERDLGLQFGNALMDRCAEVWVFGSQVSRGMKAEIERAKRRHYKIRCFTERCEERREVLT